MNELLLILLPLAAYTGWWLAKSESRGRHDASQSDEYFRGLDYLLDDDTDKAIAIFTELARININATNQRDIQHCITLGRLLRKRGEVDRALHLHQSLLTGISQNPSDFPDALIADIHLSLGDDFNDAGVMNRAETHYQSALSQGVLDTQRLAGKKLIELHTRQRQWQAAIEVSQQLDKHSQQQLAKRIAHCYCELAINHEQYDTQLNLALKIDPNCVRANVMLAERALEDGRFITAIGNYKAAEKQSPAAIIAHLTNIKRAFLALNQAEEWQTYLHALYQHCPHPNVALLIAENLSQQDAQRYLQTVLSEHPSFRILSAYFAKTDRNAHNLVQLVEQKALPFICNRCGFRTATHQWQCPGCGELETIHIA